MSTINEYPIEQVLDALGVNYHNRRFNHACSHDGGSGATQQYYAQYNLDNTFKCYRCSSTDGIGNVTKLIKDHLGFETLKQVHDWAESNLADIEISYDFEQVDKQYLEDLSAASFLFHERLVANKEVLDWVKSTYSIGDEQIEGFSLGLIDSKAIEAASPELVESHKLDKYLNFVSIPVVKNGYVLGLTLRRCDLFEHDNQTSKYIRVREATDTKESLFNYDRVLSSFRKNTNTIKTLIVCEGEMDVIALSKHVPTQNAVAVSSASSSSFEQRQQISTLSKLAATTLIMFDNDEAGAKGADTLARKLLDVGVDAKLFNWSTFGDLPDKFDAADFVADETNLPKLDAYLVESVFEQDTYLQNYINSNRLSFKAHNVTDFIFNAISRQPKITWDSYCEMLAKPPGDSKANRYSYCKISPKTSKAAITALHKARTKQSKSNRLIFADEAEANRNRYPSHDYWFDAKEQNYYGQKLVWADLQEEVETDNGPKQCQVMRPILVTTRSTLSGTIIGASFKPLYHEELDDMQANKIPESYSNEATLLPWTIKGESNYTLDNFVAQGGEVEVDFPKLFDEIKEYFRSYIYFKEDVFADIMACYTIFSYIYMAVPAVPYFHVTGASGSGKSTLALAMTQLSYRPLTLVNPRASHIYRVMHSNRGIMVIDEEERMFEATSERLQEIISICNSSYTRSGAMIPRQQKVENKRFETEYFLAYGPKVFTSIKPLPTALNNRCIKIEAVASPKGLVMPSIENDLIRLESKIQTIRDKLMVWSLTEFANYKNLYDSNLINYRQDQTLNNRDIQLWLPILTVACMADSDGQTVKRLIDYCGDVQVKRREAKATSDHYEVLQFFFEYIRSADYEKESHVYRNMSQEEERIMLPYVIRQVIADKILIRLEEGGPVRSAMEGSINKVMKKLTQAGVIKKRRATDAMVKQVGCNHLYSKNQHVYGINEDTLIEILREIEEDEMRMKADEV